MADLAGAPALSRLFERLRRVRNVSAIVLATSDLPGDDVIADFVASLQDIKLWRGPEQDVLKRYADAARHFDLDPVVRITADCPLIDPICIEDVVKAFQRMPACAYADNVSPRTFPHGFDVQVVSKAALEAADAESCQPHEREHVMPFVTTRPDRFAQTHVVAADACDADLRLTLDFPEDLDLIQNIYELLYPRNPAFDLSDIRTLFAARPGLLEINRKHVIYG